MQSEKWISWWSGNTLKGLNENPVLDWIRAFCCLHNLNMLLRLLGPDEIKDAADWCVAFIYYIFSHLSGMCHSSGHQRVWFIALFTVNSHFHHMQGYQRKESLFSGAAERIKGTEGSLFIFISTATVGARWLYQYEQITIFIFFWPTFHYRWASNELNAYTESQEILSQGLNICWC